MSTYPRKGKVTSNGAVAVTSAGLKYKKSKKIFWTLGRKKSREDICVADGSGVSTIAANGFMNGTSGEEDQRAEDIYPDGPLQSGTNSLRRVKNKAKHILELEPRRTQRFMLPLFGKLGRAVSASQVNTLSPTHQFTNTGSSLSNLSSLENSDSPSVSPSDSVPPSILPTYMPYANRRQRRASLSDIGFGKVQTYTKLEKLGEGTYATVFKGRSSISGKLVALKDIRLEHEEGAPCTAIREISLLKDLKHANIVTLHDIIHTPNSLMLVFEYVEMDLKRYMDDCSGMMSMANVKLFLFQLLRGLAYCHARRILHRDLKPQNLLISIAGDLKLADFGLARAKSVPTKTYSNEVVTLWYRPPDVLLGSTTYSDNIDMWGVGCIFFEMACGRPMFPGSSVEEELLLQWKILGTPTEETWPGIMMNTEFIKGNYPTYEVEPLQMYAPRLDTTAIDLLGNLLHFESKDRVQAKPAMRHSYFDSLGQRLHSLPHTVSIFTLPECNPVVNPGQKRTETTSNSRERRKSCITY